MTRMGMRRVRKVPLTPSSIHSHIVVGDAMSFAPQGHYDVIVSNPPYQDNIAGKTHVRNRSKSLPIYQEFWDKALSMSPNVMAFIIPAKWYAGGWGLDDFRKEMLADRHIVRLSDYRTSEQIFGDDMQVNGGICWIVRDADATTDTPRITTHDASGSVTYDGQRLLTVPGCPILLRDEQSFSIVRKACECKDRIGLGSVSDYMIGTTPFGLPASVDGFEHHDVRNNASDVDVLCIKRRHVFAPRKSITRRTSDIDKWQVAVQLCHNQYDANPMSETVLLPPGTACTHSWVCTESFDDSSEAMAMKSYMDTHVCRYLVSLAKISPIGTRRIYALVPMLPMTHEWDDKSVAKTLRLTDDELAYAIECIQRNNI
jgi:site-specific DNA-methyltransferase (adenine-specific)